MMRWYVWSRNIPANKTPLSKVIEFFSFDTKTNTINAYVLLHMCTWHTHTRCVYDYLNFLSLLLCRFALTHYLDCENILMSHVWMAWHVEIGLASWHAYAVYTATVNNEKFFFRGKSMADKVSACFGRCRLANWTLFRQYQTPKSLNLRHGKIQEKTISSHTNDVQHKKNSFEHTAMHRFFSLFLPFLPSALYSKWYYTAKHKPYTLHSVHSHSTAFLV